MKVTQSKLLFCENVSSESMSLLRSLAIKLPTLVTTETSILLHSDNLKQINPVYFNVELQTIHKKLPTFNGYVFFTMH